MLMLMLMLMLFLLLMDEMDENNNLDKPLTESLK